MRYNLPHSQSAVFEKAKDIFTLSKGLFDSLQYDLSPLQKDGKESQEIYFTGDIIRQSAKLFPEIIHAEQKPYLSDKTRHAALVGHLTKRLYNTCLRLERSLTHSKDFVWMLRTELKKFQKLQKYWRLTL